MGNEIKSGFGYIIPLGGIVGFTISIIMGNFLLSIMFPIIGMLTWFLYIKIMEVNTPNIIGNVIIVFGGLLSIGIFLSYGIKQNLFGGMEFNLEGAVFALLSLFFCTLVGMLFNRNGFFGRGSLTRKEKEMVDNAIKGSGGESAGKVIVLKSDNDNKKEDNVSDNETVPYYAYPPNFDYYDEDDADYDEDDEE